jgi:hypothetical protein
MIQVTGLTADAKQSQTLVLPDGSLAPFYMEYWDNQEGWFFTMSYGTAWSGVMNKRLVVSPNMLRAYRNIIPFGLALTTIDGYEPVFINDFINGRATLYLLDQTDIFYYEGVLTENYLLSA